MVALTTLKAFFQIGYLWKPENQRVRELHLVPFDEFSGTSWFAPLFEYAGNTAFFIPFGLLVFTLCRSVKVSTAWGFALSLTLETAQYAFALGRTDIDDLLFNTLGALIGAAIALSTRNPPPLPRPPFGGRACAAARRRCGPFGFALIFPITAPSSGFRPCWLPMVSRS